MNAIFTLEEQNALTNAASPIASAAVSNVLAAVGRSSSSSAMSSDKGVWTVAALVYVVLSKCRKFKRQLQNRQKACHAKKREVAENFFEPAGLAADLVHEVVITLFPSASGIVDPRAYEMMVQLTSSKVSSY